MEAEKEQVENNHEQGCSLDEPSRIQVLKTMGIQPWFSKFANVQAAESAQPVTETVVEHHEPAAQSPIKASNSDQAQVSANEVTDLNWLQLQQVISQCQLCELHAHRTQTVFGVGNPDADLMIIGEAPGEEEDRVGESFVGESGLLLDAMLKAIGLNREKVFITNALKCCPPDNRKPHVSEIVCCDAYLQRQIELVQPKLILALGRIAAHHLLVTKEPLSSLRSEFHNYNGIPLLVSYHPAYLIRKPIEKRKSWQDLLQVNNKLKNI